MYFVAKLHSTAPFVSDVPNIYVLHIDKDVALQLKAYVSATLEVQNVAKQFDGAVSGVTFDFTGDFLNVPDEVFRRLGLDDLEYALWATRKLRAVDGIYPSSEITCHQVTAHPDGKLHFSCVVDSQGIEFWTETVPVGVVTGECRYWSFVC